MKRTTIQEMNDRVLQEGAFVDEILTSIQQVIVGQEKLLRRMIVALLSDGHILIEGVPGLAKTLAVRTLADTIHAQFQRIQFTPDLLPSDIIGTQIYYPNTNEFVARKGPIVANIILADEINRASAKVQSAMLEAMEERQITVGDTTFYLDNPFMVLATQNPVEQEGTYPLPEAQLDRFMLKVQLDYPTRADERTIIQRMASTQPVDNVKPIIEPQQIVDARAIVDDIYIDDRVIEYILDIIQATRNPEKFNLKRLETLINVGASPRATLFLVKAAKATAFMSGRGYVTPDDIKSIAVDVLQHRLVLSFEAQADGINSSKIIEAILKRIEVP